MDEELLLAPQGFLLIKPTHFPWMNGYIACVPLLVSLNQILTNVIGNQLQENIN